MDHEISKPGYLKQRMKLNPEAYRELMRHHAKNYYADGDASYDFKGYLLLAEDGSSCNVPLTDENVSAFGSVVQHKDRKPRPQIGIASLFDVGNRMLIDLTTEFSKFDERASAIKHISAERDVIGERKAIHIFDRGYPSGNLFLHFQKNSIYFIARLASFHYKKEQLSMKTNDEWLDIIFDKSRVSAIRRAGNETAARKMEAVGKIRLRFVRITTPTGTTVCLATNIPESLADTDEMEMLYHKRWGIETAFDDLKNKLQIENFTGSKPVIIEQDVYATGYLYNIMVDIMQDADIERTTDESDYKYPLQINRNIAIGWLGLWRFALAFRIMEQNTGCSITYERQEQHHDERVNVYYDGTWEQWLQKPVYDCPTIQKKQIRKVRNTSLISPQIAQRISELKGVPCAEVLEVTSENAIKLFGLKDRFFDLWRKQDPPRI